MEVVALVTKGLHRPVENSQNQLVEARRIINLLVRTCRQVQTYFDGVSVMDKTKVLRVLQDAVNTGERFLGT